MNKSMDEGMVRQVLQRAQRHPGYPDEVLTSLERLKDQLQAKVDDLEAVKLAHFAEQQLLSLPQKLERMRALQAQVQALGDHLQKAKQDGWQNVYRQARTTEGTLNQRAPELLNGWVAMEAGLKSSAGFCREILSGWQ